MYGERSPFLVLLLVSGFNCAILQGDWYGQDDEPKFNCSNGKIIRAELRCDGYPDCSVYHGGRWLDRDTSDEESCSDKQIEEEVEIDTGERYGGKVVVLGRQDMIRMQNANRGNNSAEDQDKTVVIGREDMIRLENSDSGYGSQNSYGGGKGVMIGRQDLIRIENRNRGGNGTQDDDDDDYDDIIIRFEKKNDRRNAIFGNNTSEDTQDYDDDEIVIEIGGKKYNDDGNTIKTGRTDTIRDENTNNGSKSAIDDGDNLDKADDTQVEKQPKILDSPSQAGDNINDDYVLNEDATEGGVDDEKETGLKAIAPQIRG